jgi:hypothetical protein
MAKYWVMRSGSSKHCLVEREDAAPVGERFKGPFDTKEEAIKEMCRLYDRTMTDTGKCWSVPSGACK